MIVGCPRRELLGAAVGIILEASKRLDRVDRGKRVFDGLRAGPGLPTEPHAPVRAVGLRSRAVCPFGGVEGLELCGASVLGSRLVKDRRLDPRAHRFVMRLTQLHGELEAAFDMFERRRACGRILHQELGQRAVGLERHIAILRGDRRGQRALGEAHQPFVRPRRRQQALFERQRIEDVVLRVGLRQSFAFGRGQRVELLEDVSASSSRPSRKATARASSASCASAGRARPGKS